METAFTPTEMKEFLLQLVERMDNSSLTKFNLQWQNMQVNIERNAPEAILSKSTPVSVVPEKQEEGVESNESSEKMITAPLIGVAYAASSPEAAPFVTVGQTVQKGDVICVIEAMKVMNEIESDQDGIVTKILFQNGGVVEYGQPLIQMQAIEEK